LFQSRGPATSNDLSPIRVLDHEVERSLPFVNNFDTFTVAVPFVDNTRDCDENAKNTLFPQKNREFSIILVSTDEILHNLEDLGNKWNQLPTSLRSTDSLDQFTKHLKMFLFVED